MVEQHYHGIWNWQLEADYADVYNEQLPLNWLQIVDTSPKVSVESFLDKYVLRYCKPEDVSIWTRYCNKDRLYALCFFALFYTHFKTFNIQS